MPVFQNTISHGRSIEQKRELYSITKIRRMQSLKKAITEYYRTKRFNLDIAKYLLTNVG